MRTGLIIAYAFTSAHAFRTQAPDEALVRALVLAIAFAVAYVALRAVGRLFKL